MSILHPRVNVRPFLKANGDPRAQLPTLIRMFTGLGASGAREALSAFLRCPLLRRQWAPTWDMAIEGELIRVGPRSGGARADPFRKNACLYLTDKGADYARRVLGRVLADYGWRPVDGQSWGVQPAIDLVEKRARAQQQPAQLGLSVAG